MAGGILRLLLSGGLLLSRGLLLYGVYCCMGVYCCPAGDVTEVSWAAGGYLSLPLLHVVAQRPRLRPNKGSAHNLAIGFDPAREY